MIQVLSNEARRRISCVAVLGCFAIFFLTLMMNSTSTNAVNRTIKGRDEYPYIPADTEAAKTKLLMMNSTSTNAVTRTNTGTIMGRDKYPYIPWSILSECGLAARTGQQDQAVNDDHDNNNELALSSLFFRQPEPFLNRSLGFIKTHKTGGSSITNIVNRVVDSRCMAKMIPKNLIRLGWPGPFPGNIFDGKKKKYNAISNHAVFNLSSLEDYLEYPITTFTILREPVSRTVSAFQYFKWSKGRSWRQFLTSLKKRKLVKQWYHATQLNSMAFDLGWYHQHNYSTIHDQDVDKIRSFIEKLDDQMDVVMILERMEESLLMLQDAIPGIAVSELINVRMKVNNNNKSGLSSPNVKKKSNELYPTESEQKELLDVLLVDRMIYDHFNIRFTEKWKSKVRQTPEMETVKQALICLKTRITDNLENEDVIRKELKDMMFRDSFRYTKLLHKKQEDKCQKLL